MYIAQHMTHNPATIGPETTIAQAADLLEAQHFRHLPVVDDEKQLLGIVTDRDIRSARPSSVQTKDEIERETRLVNETPVRQIMSTEVATLSPISTLDDALLLFGHKMVGCLPVVDEERQVVGMFSIRDLMRAYGALFGLGERGSALVAVRHDGKPRPLTRIVHLLEEHDIHFSRVVRAKAVAGTDSPELIFIRVNTFNLHAVHRVLEDAGFTLEIPRPVGQDAAEG